MYARVWRWHFFAGLFVAPFATVLALSGSVYLFSPQIDAAIQASVDRDLGSGPSLPADTLVEAAKTAVGGGELRVYRIPAEEHATARIEMAPAEGPAQLVWVERATGNVVSTQSARSHPLEIAKTVHGELFAGRLGSAVVELAACWLIVLILSGVYLAWPRGERKRLGNVLFPRIRGTRRGLRDLHAAVGVWVGGFVLVFLLTGLPWTGVFGAGLERVQALTGTDGPGQEFRVTLQSAPAPEGATELDLQAVVDRAARQALAWPVEISPPRGSSGVWTVRSMTPRRPDRVTLHYDRFTGEELLRIGFDDYPMFKRAVSYGIALHEGALFGPLNQLLGVLIALGVITLAVTGPLLWWQRRPRGSWAVPVAPAGHRLGWGLTGLIVVLAILLPLVGASLLIVLALESLWGGLRSGRERERVAPSG